MGLPNLLIVGAAKSGTTSLHNYLNQHNDIFMSSHKEPHFLINNDIGKNRVPNGIINEENYRSLFNGQSNKLYRGESSVLYLLYPQISIANIKKYLSNEVKIIIMLRNPVERAFSGYQHVKRYNIMEDLSFEDALQNSESRYSKIVNMTPASRYLEIGMYYLQVKAFLDSFKHVHIIIYDDYKTNFKLEMKKLFDFLEVDLIQINNSKKYMVGGWQWKSSKVKKIMIQPNLVKTIAKYILPFKDLRKLVKKLIRDRFTNSAEIIDPKTEKYLKDYYSKDIDKLGQLLNRNLKNWTE